jgi:Outer membrane protein beta-barrel domain
LHFLLREICVSFTQDYLIKMTKSIGLIMLSICMLAAIPLIAQKQRLLTGIYFQDGLSTYRPFRDIQFCYEVGGTGSYPISRRLTWDINLGYSRNGLSHNEYTQIPGTFDVIVQRISRLHQVKLEFGIGVPDRGRVRWTFGGFVGVLMFAHETETQLSNRGTQKVGFDITNQIKKYDYGLQIAMHGTLSDHWQVDLKLRQGLPNLRPAWSGISTQSQAALVGVSWFPTFAMRKS